MILGRTEPIETPMYLADSILAERRLSLLGLTYVLKTSTGEFAVPVSIVEKRATLATVIHNRGSPERKAYSGGI
jgi:hypothetical protein